jgi:hypothetical protein
MGLKVSLYLTRKEDDDKEKELARKKEKRGQV